MRRTALILGTACMAAIAAAPAAVTRPRPAAIGTGAEWWNYNGDMNETGFSRLAQINKGNVRNLGIAWSLELPGEASLEATPLAVGGMLYFTGSYAKVYAVNAATGKLVWTFDPKTWQFNPSKMHAGFGANRGAAYANGKIFSAALDG